MKNTLLILVSFLTFSIGLSQNYGPKEEYLIDFLDLDEIDSTDKNTINDALVKFKLAKHDTDKVNAINYIVDEVYNPVVGKAYNNWLYEFLKNKKGSNEVLSKFYKNRMSQYWNNAGIYYSDLDMDDSVEYSYLKALEISSKLGDSRNVASAYNNLGLFYGEQGKLALSLDYLLKAFAIHKREKNKLGIIVVTTNLADLYFVQDDIEKTRYYYELGLKLSRELGDDLEIAISCNNMGTLLSEEGDFQSSLDHHQEALELYKKVGSEDGIATSYHNIGSVYEDLDSIDLARIYFKKSVKIARKLQSNADQSSTILRLAWLEFDFGSLELARQYGMEAHQLAVKSNKLYRIKATTNFLANYYKETGNVKKELEFFKAYIKLEDSVSNKTNTKKLLELRFQSEYDQKTLQDSIVQAESQKVTDAQIEAGNLKIAAQKKQKWYLYGGLGLLALFSIFIFKRFRIAKKQKLIIESQKTQVDLAFAELEEKNNEILDSITYAKRIQSAILPPRHLVSAYLENSFILYKPKDIVAGDFYWMEPKNDLILFAAADCTGHGVPGAMVSVICNNGLNRSVREHHLLEPGKILDKTREIVIGEFEKSEDDVKDGMDIALCSLQGNQLKYAGANNPLWIIRKNATEVEEIKADKQPIGIFSNIKPYTTHEVELNKGDSFYIFSDGYADQFGGERNKKFKSINLKKLLLSIQHLNMSDQKTKINEAFENWKLETEQLDDVCVIGVQF